MQWCAVGLLEIASTAAAMQLAPRATAGMPVGSDIAQPYPAAIATVGIGTEMVGGVDLARRRQRLGWPLIPYGTLVWPGIMQHDAEPEKPQEHQLVEKEV